MQLEHVTHKLKNIGAEYQQKIAEAGVVVSDFENCIKDCEMRSTLLGKYAGRIWGFHPSLSEQSVRESLLKSAWRAVYGELRIAQIATAKDRERFGLLLEKPPEFTMENVRTQFAKYLADPRAQVLRGLAEAFCNLDPAFKSHSKVKIGVSALPKRMIIQNVCSDFGHISGYGADEVKDVLNALRAYRGQGLMSDHEAKEFLKVAEWQSFGVPEWKPNTDYRSYSKVEFEGRLYEYTGYYKNAADSFEIVTGTDETGWIELTNKFEGIKLVLFQNGNGHLHFDKRAMDEINKGIAEYYGDVLPDVDGQTAKQRPGTAVAKDLQYYPTPPEAVDELLKAVKRFTNLEGKKILEPSCGCGRILDALLDKGITGTTGIEIDPERAHMAKAKGHGVVIKNFLEMPDLGEFDIVVMNPPFYGQHYLKHLEKAKGMLKPGGVLASILPATAYYDHGKLEKCVPGYQEMWRDLPVGSFAESGTNVPTGIYTYMKPA